MTTFEELLGAVGKLNDPANGATKDWKHNLLNANNQAPNVKIDVASLSENDEAFYRDLQQFINEPESQTKVEKLIQLIDDYLGKANEQYDSLMKFRFLKNNDKKTAENVKDAYSNLYKTLEAVKKPLALWVPP